MIKIIHFITDTNVGGAGNLLCEQINGTDTQKFRVFVALPRRSALIKKLAPLPCTIIEYKHGADKSFSVENLRECYEIIKKLRPDIVHSHGSLSSRIAATALKIPCRVFTRHCAPPLSKIAQNPLIKHVFKVTNNVLSTSIIAVSPFAKQNLIEMGALPQNINTIINGVSPIRHLTDAETEFFRTKYGLTKENFVISYFARLEEIKGHKTLLCAAEICKKYYPNFRFFIVGTGSLEQPLKKRAKKLRVDDTVCFLGYCDDVAPIYNVTDINLSCSNGSETSSLSLCEGMSLGIPSIASNVAGNPYIVKSGENGLLFPTNDSGALAMAIIRLYRDKELYQKCSRGALIRYHNELNDRIMCKKMNDFYLREHQKAKNRQRVKKIRLEKSLR